MENIIHQFIYQPISYKMVDITTVLIILLVCCCVYCCYRSMSGLEEMLNPLNWFKMLIPGGGLFSSIL